jgi:phosphate transport system substrate-binding protein
MNFKKWMLFLAMAALLALAACGGNEESAEDAGENEEALSGEVAIDGSSTVLPIMEALAEEYQIENPEVRVTVGGSGTGNGFDKFAAGETHFSDASRPIKEEEAALLEEAGIEYSEFTLAYDGLSIVLNPENTWVDQLTVEELNKMFAMGSEVKTWADVREGWPEEEIEFFVPGTGSGTYDYFNEEILEESGIRQDAQASEDDNVLVTGVSGSKNGIGFFGYAYYLENQDKLKVAPIVNPETNEAVTPDFDTIQSGEYAPLSRPLFTYAKHDALTDAAVYDYAQFALENAGPLAEEVGYVALPEEKYQEQLDKLAEVAGK